MKTAKEQQIEAKRVHRGPNSCREAALASQPLPKFGMLNLWNGLVVRFCGCSIGTPTRKEKSMANAATKTTTAAPSDALLDQA